MEFRIADTFTDSLARLTGDEQKAVKTTAFDLQLNPANPGMSFHKLDKVKDKSFWSVRVNSDIRLIVHRSEASILLCYVGHHDKAYDWAERRKLETHPKTGAAQLVEIRETVKEIVVPVYVQTEAAAAPKPPPELNLLFAERSDDELLGYGVPAEWLNDVKAATEDTLLVVADHLPAEAAEALLELATGGKPRVSRPAAVLATSEVVRAPCASIIVPPIRSARRRTGCSVPLSPTWMATVMTGAIRFQYSTDLHRQFRRSRARSRKLRRSAIGLQGTQRPAWCRTNSACSSDRRRNWTARKLPQRRPEWRSRFLMRTSKPPVATSQSAPCTWRRGWNFGPSP
jgi:mRNA-degrading endonuclease RelE of RelBE toxin-antitoxin system